MSPRSIAAVVATAVLNKCGEMAFPRVSRVTFVMIFQTVPATIGSPVDEIQRALVSAFDKSSKAGRASFR